MPEAHAGGGDEQIGNVQPNSGATCVNIRKMCDKKREPNMTSMSPDSNPH